MSTATLNGKASILGNREKPQMPPVDASQIHDGLKMFDRWTGWRWEWKLEKEKWDKPPFDVGTSGYGSSTNPAKWHSWQKVYSAYQQEICDGVGFVLGEADGGIHFAGLDLDDCRNPVTGELTPLAQEIVSTMNTYAEVSPTGTGIKILCIGKLPEMHATTNKAGTVEIYSGGRYFTVTGQRLPDAPKRVEQRQAELEEVWNKYIGNEKKRRETSYQSNGKPHANASGLLAAMLRIRPKAGENDGSNRLLAVCCRGVEFNAEDSVIVATIREYEQQHPFPANWSDDDILRRIRDAEQRTERGKALIVKRPLTDLGNAERFVDQHGDQVRFVPLWHQWFVYDGTRFKPDTTAEVNRLAKQTVRSIFKEAADADDKEERKAICQWAFASEKRERIGALLALAGTENPFAVDYASLDSDPWLLNCSNGTLSLSTFELQPHDPGDLITKSTGVEYPMEPGVDAILWQEFLLEIFDGNTELIAYVQRLFGASLVGVQIEHLLAILYGNGANGKSVFTFTIQAALGDYAMTGAASLLMAKRNEQHPTEVADLFGKRLVVISETRDGARLDEGLVKSITGGDKIRARRMRENFWEFAPSHLPVIATNHKPVVRGTDLGIWRRLRLIPFNVTIPPERQDKRLADKLKAELPAILRWLVEGCREWQRNGLQEPPIVLAATDEYRRESDTFSEWFEEHLNVEPFGEVKASEAIQNYQSWCKERGERPLSGKSFGQRIGERIAGKRLSNGTYYQGIAWRS